MSNPTWPVYTFKVNLKELDRYSTSQPCTRPDGENLKYARSSFLASLFPGFEIIADKDEYTFTAYGSKAKYLKDTYVTGSPNDVLQLVS